MALIDNVKESRSMKDIKSALAEIGVDVKNINDLEDVATAIRGCSAGPQVVVNATLSGGHGIKVTPQDRKGYKISGNSDIVLTQDLNTRIQSGTTVTKALYNIVNYELPKAMEMAIQSPAIVGIEIFRAECDGIDYYDNKAFGKEGKGRKSGLRPYGWYMKIYTPGQCEPIYLDFGPLTEGIRREFLAEAAHQTEAIVERMLSGHHKPNKPDYDFPWDRPERPERPEKPNNPDDDDWCDKCEMPKPKCKHHHKHDKPQHGLPTTEPDGWLGPQIVAPPFDFDGDEGMMFDEDDDFCDKCEDIETLIKNLQA